MRLIKARNNDLVSSQLHDEKSFFAAFSKDFKLANHKVIIESPFMTKRRAQELAPLCRKSTNKGVLVTIYTRDPSHHEGSLMHQAGTAIRILEAAGATIVICSDMRHRKLAFIDSKILWEGSLNMLSHSNSREIMRRSVSKDLCREMMDFIGLR